MSIERSPGSSGRPWASSARRDAAQGLARVAGEDVEQVELHRGQRDLVALGVAQHPRLGVEGAAADLDRGLRRSRRPRGGRIGRLQPAQHGADAGEELARLEGLDHVVVGAVGQPGQPVAERAGGGQQDHARRACRRRAAAPAPAGRSRRAC